MNYLEPPYFWLIIGALLLALEAFGASGVGFLFAGLGAITAGLAAQAGMAVTIWAQLAWFFGATSLWALLLWKPMKNFSQQKSGYQNMVGGEAIVLAPGLMKGQSGKVRWSGTIMEARLLAEATVEKLEPDTVVIIREVQGNTLIVSPQ